ncbi:hypothetical protein BLNAU_24846 [Blattamonas nauphoetae]|uniref:Uncharacterized protein n=1 Tax=Blattamonas nauphoetae TaxID=2049346 RepID=A0ABQ9WNB9_9EUKA|nr:hypothetical protein BLNAU_24846 [Blattamonas nauphoetae]
MVACPEEFKNVIYQNRIAAASYIASSILPATRFPSLCQLLDSRTNVPQIFSSALTSPRVYWHVVDKCFLLDGTTDSTGTKQIACHLRVLNDNNQPFSMLLSIRPLLKEADGRAHFDLVNSLFDEFDLPANSLVGIGTDGESTMTGLGNALQSADLNFVSVDSLLQHTRESIHSHIDPYLLISDAIDSLSSQTAGLTSLICGFAPIRCLSLENHFEKRNTSLLLCDIIDQGRPTPLFPDGPSIHYYLNFCTNPAPNQIIPSSSSCATMDDM